MIHPDRLDAWFERHVATPDAIVHMGAISATDATDADRVMQVNFDLSWRLWQWCTRRRNRLLYVSSSATYSDGMQG